MTLFEIRNNRAFPSVHSLLIEPFKSIWRSDESPDKEMAIKYFSYIELLCSPRKSNPFYGYSEKERPSKVAKEVFGNPNYNIDPNLLFAVATYKDLLSNSSISYQSLVDAEFSLNKTREFLRNFEPNSRTSMGGSLLLKPKDILLANKELPNAIARIIELRNKVHEELEESDIRTRNQREIGAFEE
jgi:hypothetical protein